MTASEPQLVPVARMRDRLRRSREDSDATYFFDVVAAGELVLKLTVTGLTAALRRDPDGHQYRIESSLVRGNGLGDWVSALDELLIGTASEHLPLLRPETHNASSRRPSSVPTGAFAFWTSLRRQRIKSIRSDPASGRHSSVNGPPRSHGSGTRQGAMGHLTCRYVRT